MNVYWKEGDKINSVHRSPDQDTPLLNMEIIPITWRSCTVQRMKFPDGTLTCPPKEVAECALHVDRRTNVFGKKARRQEGRLQWR